MKLVYAVCTATVTRPAGPPVNLRLGEPWAANDPFVAERPDLFSDEPIAGSVRHTAPIEQATRAPGEKRGR